MVIVMQWNDKQPIYQQLKEKIATAIMEGAIKEGDAIPSIRTVCTDYQINPMTASKAYQVLVDDNIIEKQRGRGMFVKDGARNRLLASEKKRFLEEEWPLILQKIKRLGLDIEELSS